MDRILGEGQRREPVKRSWASLRGTVAEIENARIKSGQN